MSKIIIENKSDRDDLTAMDAVKIVISRGRISNNGKQYGYVTSVCGVRVLSRLNGKSDGFIVMNKEYGT